MMFSCPRLVVGIVCSLVSIVLWAADVNSVSIEETKAFLARYSILSTEQSGLLTDLYSDRAVISIRTDNQPNVNVFQGRAYKQWLRDLVRQKTVTLDAVVYKDVVLERRNNRLVVRAKRYSTNRCYWDGNYQIALEREGAQYKIVEELVTTQPGARCDVARTQRGPAVAYNSAMTTSVIATPQAFTPGISPPNYGAMSTMPVMPSIAPVIVGARRAVPVQSQSMPELPPRMSPEEQMTYALQMAQRMAGNANVAAGASPSVGLSTTGAQSLAPVLPASWVSPATDMRVTPQSVGTPLRTTPQ